jgi:V/A-type H+/Na+-transporting ATPase subunit A
MATANPPPVLATVSGVKESLIRINISGLPIMKNEVGHIILGEQRLKAEVLRIQDQYADLQVFEDTRGVKVGDQVELSGALLSISLGPGLLGQVLDGLGKPLKALADQYGFFLPRGRDIDSLDDKKQWEFTPQAGVGELLVAGQVIGSVKEGAITHNIMMPFDWLSPAKLTWIRPGNFSVNDTIARVQTSTGFERSITLMQRWAVRRAIPQRLLKQQLTQRCYPTEPMITQQRIIDTFFPIALGGTACIPGPFGAGKTVLQNLIARYANVDIVIIIACGERAGEVVETINEYPETIDPKTGRSLMERTIIICNTSSMPVAARESSIYTGITLGEYYRQMGYKVLCIADSTSRWAQAMRETSGRMEEIPGEEAFPAYLDSSIKSIYERAGVIRSKDGRIGSLTFIGTVSPAGGNFEEPVTQATLSTVKTFLGLSSERAYKRFYPAIDPLISWSRYLEQCRYWYAEHIGDQWITQVKAVHALLRQGDNIEQMMQVTGEEGVSLADFILYQKARLVDRVYLQQDAFDTVDAATSSERQQYSFHMLQQLIESDYHFDDKDTARDFFTNLTSLYKNFNYAETNSEMFIHYRKKIAELAAGAGGWIDER